MDDEWRMAAAVRRPSSAATAGLALGLIPTGVLVLLRSAAVFATWVMALGIQVLWREPAHRRPDPLTHGG